ncbi:4-alpha-glucanotransferase [Stutzerimonas nosocomialis]|uniref:4-alpha-glucanotransferase n=1 Tax=Stutzerimonas nosocomialis TaxID=1056496 RepID=A0A5R9Q931_9GAMM|nr:4-alpha-glucanotransferase [Stutzerimonas nosocomialis]TLX61639.1 4-alpha-glucanotransferase [Stutzerimonas nosocomialis]
MSDLKQLAWAAGLSIDWVDADGNDQRVPDDVLRKVLAALGLEAGSDEQIRRSLQKLEESVGQAQLPPLMTVDLGMPLDLGDHFAPDTPYSLSLEDQTQPLTGTLDARARLPGIETPGYHQLSLDGQRITVAVAPEACPSVEDVAGPGAWGLTVQLYGLRRPGDGGVGDTEALEDFARNAAQHGASAIGISPVHAMFPGYPNQYSPYSPSSRLFFNVLHSSPGSILGERRLRQAIDACGLADELQRLEALELVDWPAVTHARMRLLRALFEDFSAGEDPLQQDFESFRAAGGEALENHCRFEALHAVLLDDDGSPQGWASWPEQYRDPASPAVQRFAEENADEISFHAFAQWLMARGLERAQVAAKSAGMGIGLIADLAVGADSGGSQAWSRQAELLSSLSVGAPPDILNRQGQSWGISAFSPWGLKQNGFRAFIEMLRANLAHAGGMRIDHVMGLMRLWVTPEGVGPDQGAYLNYPFDDMLRLLTLEAWRHKAVILGEDLGTVPEGLSEKLAARGILGMRVLLFERDDEARFVPPREWPDDALATTATHDIPSIAGWWQANDIDWRIRVGQVDESKRKGQMEERERERHGLVRALREDTGSPAGDEMQEQEVVDGATSFIGHTPAPLVLLPLEDALGLVDQPNLPGTIDSHPNWRRRYAGDSATLLDAQTPARRLERLAQARRQSLRSRQ